MIKIKFDDVYDVYLNENMTDIKHFITELKFVIKISFISKTN